MKWEGIRKIEERYAKLEKTMSKNEIIICIKTEKITTPIAETKEGQQKIRAEVRKVLKEFRYERNIKQ